MYKTARYFHHFVLLVGCFMITSVNGENLPNIAPALEQVKQGNYAGALNTVNEVIAQQGENDAAYELRAKIYHQLGRLEETLVDLDKVIKYRPNDSRAYNFRGTLRFQLGDAAGSAGDYDKAILLEPRLEQRHWQRGLAYFYCGKYLEGAKQFETYQTYDDSDVENVAWKFLCQVKVDGVDKAREGMMTLGDIDRRQPMMKIDALYRGKGSVAQVFEEPAAEFRDERWEKYRKFYGHLYVGLYLDAIGEDELAEHHILAADKLKNDHYMWYVAHLHANRIREARDGQ